MRSGQSQPDQGRYVNGSDRQLNRNVTIADHDAGQRNWDELIQSMRTHGYDPNQPVEFIITWDNKLQLHQGHHRVGAALQLGIAEIPVRFWFK